MINNPMLQNITQNRAVQNLSHVKTMYDRIRNVSNPQTAINEMMKQNPTMKQAMDYVNATGGDYEKAFFKLAKEMGVNPQDILNALR